MSLAIHQKKRRRTGPPREPSVVASGKHPRAPSHACSAFLRFIDEARLSLAADILKHNAPRDLIKDGVLDEITRHVVTRWTVLRLCDDRGIDLGPALRAFLRREHLMTHAELVTRIHQLRVQSSPDRELFANALFDQHPAGEPQISDKWLSNFAAQLCAPDAGFATATARDDILGVIHEHTLRTPLVISSEGVAALSKKGAGGKTRGVYYTPGYIADHLIGQTAARALEGKTPSEVARLRFLDPACGSGALLIPLYARVLEYHRRWFHVHGGRRAGFSGDFYVDETGEVRLTRAFRSRILLENIHGVDIDPRAIEITRLSLHLKLLADEHHHTNVVASGAHREEQVSLPSLEKNILCGNALIASDFSPDPIARTRVKAFDWTARFAPILAAGGFDAVIANPPYVPGECLDNASREYFKRHYRTARRQLDLYHLFLERGLQLTKKNGYHGCIVPDAILARDDTALLRRILVDEHALFSVAHVGAVFPDAGVSAAVLCAQAFARPGPEVFIYQLSPGRPPARVHVLDLARIARDPDAKLLTANSAHDDALLEKIRALPLRLGSLCRFSRGEELGKKQLLPSAAAMTDREPIRVGSEVHRYSLRGPHHHVPAAGIKKERSLYAGPKLLLVKTGRRPQAAYDTSGTVTLQSLYNVHGRDPTVDLRAILALLNSAVASWYLRKTVTSGKKLFPQFNQNHFEQFPIPACPPEATRALAALADRMISATSALRSAENPADRAALQSALHQTDRAVDALVYSLYDLSPGEIAIIEASEPRQR